MVKTKIGKKVRHGGDKKIKRSDGINALYTGMGGWKGARRSGTGMNDINTRRVEKINREIKYKPWKVNPVRKRDRKTRGIHIENLKIENESKRV